ncbi:ribosome silencing factor [Catenovulum sp. 2E275]|uniref:ribosome silencing factor n=1 Tax=Catenovulum sp. 2E275 TaxID=2980497 RepID=UPI0021CFFCCF|nr:ribosome silencing factor [Catenovulum sp. 2E275]MCU4675437.1 ribosome silencing factor [Catenovulum sp. 2E275]
MQSEEIKNFITEKVDDMKARDIVELDLKDKSNFTDTMLVCSGNSKQHVRSIAQYVATEAKHAGHQPLGIEGEEYGEWALVDFGSVVLHVMTDEQREHYQLEKLWQA